MSKLHGPNIWSRLCQCEGCQRSRRLDAFIAQSDIQWPVVRNYRIIESPPPPSFLHRVAFKISDIGSYLNSEWLWAKGGAFEYYLDERWYRRQKTRRPIIMRDKRGEQYFVKPLPNMSTGVVIAIGICTFILSAMVVYHIGLDY